MSIFCLIFQFQIEFYENMMSTKERVETGNWTHQPKHLITKLNKENIYHRSLYIGFRLWFFNNFFLQPWKELST